VAERGGVDAAEVAYLSACEAVYLAVARDGGLTPRVQALVAAADDAWWAWIRGARE
jgi:hypothetical protein